MRNRILYLSLFCSLLFTACSNKQKGDTFESRDLEELKEAGEITAVTLYGSTTYFQYKMQLMGYEYDLIKEFADTYNLTLHMKVANNLEALLDMLENGEADVVAYPMQVTNQDNRDLLYCGHENLSTQVLVQRANKEDTLLTDVTGLIGKDVYVYPDSRFADRIENLNKELGGGIHIKELPKDSASVEDLIEMVSRGEIPYTVCDDYTARLNKTYFWNIDVGLQVSFVQRTSWVVRKSSPELADAINKWAEGMEGKRIYKAASKRYFELSKSPSDEGMPLIQDGNISPFDAIFQKHAPKTDWGWQLLASIAYQESRFNPRIVSWAGAVGLMGIMPNTARHLGVNPGELKNPDVSVRTGVECLLRFSKGFSKIEDPVELMKFTLASYNAGNGHIYDAQRLAEKYGKNPNLWEDVSEYVRLKSEPEYYNDPVCKHGYLRGTETFNYVIEVTQRYEYYKKRTG